MVVIGVVERFRRKEVHWKAYTAVVAFLLVVAFYMSWREQRIAVDAKPKAAQEIKVTEIDRQARAELATTRKDLQETQQKLSAANKEIDVLKKQVSEADNWVLLTSKWKC